MRHSALEQRSVNGVTDTVEIIKKCSTVPHPYVVLKRTERAGLTAGHMRVLVVDDFKSVRQMISSILKKELRLETISEACDGREAVELAAKLQPHLIILDIGLPKQNGLEAARQIREVASKSTILFVSQHCSEDIVREAFESGGSGYVLKADLGELTTAVMRVLRGGRFISSSLADYDFLADSEES